jgi:uncharacterized protein
VNFALKISARFPPSFANDFALSYLRHMPTAQFWIDSLGLLPHVEGGFFKESYRASEILSRESLPERFVGPRAILSSIYFLLMDPSVSYLHRLKSDEIWLYHTGSPLTLHIIRPGGEYTRQQLGINPGEEHHPQVVVERGSWFGATVGELNGFSLVSCVVAPAFEFADFELADRRALTEQFPQHADIITMLTRPSRSG